MVAPHMFLCLWALQRVSQESTDGLCQGTKLEVLESPGIFFFLELFHEHSSQEVRYSAVITWVCNPFN